MPYWKDSRHRTLYKGDARNMSELSDETIQCVVTSPPYWGLRKYSGSQDLIWGGDNSCEHEWFTEKRPSGGGHVGEKAKVGATKAGVQRIFGYKADTCQTCGAWRGAYGLEPTPEMYVEHTIEILREIRRVLRKDGVCFLNIGDSYAGSGSPGGDYRNGKGGDEYLRPYNHKGNNLKPKDLCLIPFRVAIAAQEDGWWVRSVIIWNKPNPMPESVRDRPTESHEYILMLTKSGTSQYWTHRDGAGTRERPKADYRWINQITKEEVALEPPDWKVKIKCPECEATGKVSIYLGMDVWQEKSCPTCNGKKETQLWKRINLWKGHDYYWDQEAVREVYDKPLDRWGGDNMRRSSHKYIDMYEETGDNGGIGKVGATSMFREGRPVRPNEAGRNLRSVWTFNEDGEQGGNFYKVSPNCPVHSPLLHPDILQMVSNDEPQDSLLTHTLDKYGCLVPVLSSSLFSKIYRNTGDDHLSKMVFHHHETELWQIAESIGDSRKLTLCCPDVYRLSGPEKSSRTKHTQTHDGTQDGNSGYPCLSCELTATEHNKEIHRIVFLIVVNDSVFLQIPDRTVHILQSLGCTCSYNHYNTSHFPLQDVWTFSTQPYKAAHFAVFPEKLPELCIKAASREGDIILDPFAGAGTTLKVAAELNRRVVGYELSEEYCKLIVERNKQQVLL